MWVLVTLFAAAFQTSRTALQHRLRELLSVSGAGFVRYAYGAPISFTAVVIARAAGVPFPHIAARFWPLIGGAGVAQILATMFLIRAFDVGTFATGTIYSKTEVVQVALFSLVFLGEGLRLFGWIAVVVCLVGVALLATKGQPLRLGNLGDRAALYGLAAGGLFGLAAVGIRAASKALSDSPKIMLAIVSLAVMNTIQLTVHGTYLVLREREQIGLTFRHWRSSAIVGVLSVCGSACWAFAFVLQNAAKVRTFGQIELVFAFVISRYWLKERHSGQELAASGLVLAGVLGVMLLG